MEIIKSEYDFYTSVEKALTEIDPKWREYKGLIVCGSHAPIDVEEKLQKIKEARKQGIPFLGICFGHQLAAIEYARNVLDIEEATSEEFGYRYDRIVPQEDFIVKKLPELKVGGYYPDGSRWNNYEVDKDFAKRWKKPQHFFTTQAHPEYESSIDNPHPLLVKFINYCKNHE